MSNQRVGFCLKCGTGMVPKIPVGDDRPRATCPNCGYIHYENAKVLAACILFTEEKVLWVRRAKEPNAGLWAMPGGYVELHETIEEAAVRELHEETRLVLSPDKLAVYGVVSIPDISQIFISLIAPMPSMDFGPTEETLEIKLAGIRDIDPTNYAYPPGADRWVHLLYERIRSGSAISSPAVLRHVRSTHGKGGAYFSC